MRRLYVITRSDLPAAYAGVQAGHAVAQYIIDNGIGNWSNEYLIYLRVKDELELIRLLTKLNFKIDAITEFREPDLENELTAIACVAPNKNMFSKLPLL